MGAPCVCGAEALAIDFAKKQVTVTGSDPLVLTEGDLVSIDGATGEVFLGEVPVMASPVVDYFEGKLDPAGADTDELVRAVHRIMQIADANRRLAVRANSDTPEDLSLIHI